MKHPKDKGDRRLVRTRQRTPDYVRKAGPHRTEPRRMSRRVELSSALEEWADDLSGTHSIFED